MKEASSRPLSVRMASTFTERLATNVRVGFWKIGPSDCRCHVHSLSKTYRRPLARLRTCVPISLQIQAEMLQGRQRYATASASSILKPDAQLRSSHIAFELVQGPLVRWSHVTPGARAPPTCVLVHGILGSRRNLAGFAQRLVRVFSSWQVLLVDLRCHGESAGHASLSLLPNTVDVAAADILNLLRHLRLFPEALIGHSFGGKVVMSMADQFGRIGPRLPRPVQVWVLDALPGSALEYQTGNFCIRQDHPSDLIPTLRRLQLPISSRADVQNLLVHKGFSERAAAWIVTNLRPSGNGSRSLSWTFDLEGIAELYGSYEEASFWPFLSAPTQGIQVDFVRAENSNYIWPIGDLDRLIAYGHRVHMLSHAGHWLHADNPDGLLDILSPTFMHVQRAH